MPPKLIKSCRLKPLLKKIGKTQRWLARQVNIHHQQIYEYANNKVDIPIVVAKNCADVLGITIDELYEWKEVTSPEWREWVESRHKG